MIDDRLDLVGAMLSHTSTVYRDKVVLGVTDRVQKVTFVECDFSETRVWPWSFEDCFFSDCKFGEQTVETMHGCGFDYRCKVEGLRSTSGTPIFERSSGLEAWKVFRVYDESCSTYGFAVRKIDVPAGQLIKKTLISVASTGIFIAEDPPEEHWYSPAIMPPFEIEPKKLVLNSGGISIETRFGFHSFLREKDAIECANTIRDWK